MLCFLAFEEYSMIDEFDEESSGESSLTSIREGVDSLTDSNRAVVVVTIRRSFPETWLWTQILSVYA